MLRVSDPKEVFDPYAWLPGHGENAVSFRLDGLDVVVDIAYEPSDGGASLVKRELRFVGVSSFYWSAFPGAAGLLNVLYDAKWQIGSLIEFERSDVADAWGKHAAGSPDARHFLMQFMSENKQLHAIARDYLLSDEVAV